MPSKINWHVVDGFSRYCSIIFAIAGLYLASSGIVDAGEIKVAPHLELSEIYSSNISLSSSNPDQALVSRISPGVTINGEGRRLDFNLDYEPELITYAYSKAKDSLYHKLQADADAELIPETLKIRGLASATQSIIDVEGPVLQDRINVGNRADVVMWSIAPRLKHDFDGFMSANVDYRTGRIYYRGTREISNSESTDYGLSLKSGRHFQRFIWQGDYSKNAITREDAKGSTRENGQASLHYNLISSLSVLARAGYENNDYQTNNAIINGSYSSAGFLWAPSERFSFDATYGDLYSDANLRWSPTVRTILELNYQDRAVGVNIGTKWAGKLEHRTRHSKFHVGYTEDITNIQRLFFIGQATLGSQDNFAVDLFSLTNEEFLRKRNEYSYSITGLRNSIVIKAFTESREYQVSTQSQDLRSIGIDWGLRFMPRTSLKINLDMQNRMFNTASREDDWIHGSIGLSTDLSAKLQGSVEYAFSQRRSTLDQNDYHENRLTLNMVMNYQGD